MDQSLEEAAHYFRLAAAKDHIQSSGQLGYLIAQALVDGSIEEAWRLLQFAKDHNDRTGILGVGYCHFKGLGVARNETLAFELFKSISGKSLSSCNSVLLGVVKGEVVSYLYHYTACCALVKTAARGAG